MEFTGRFKDAVKDWATGKWCITFTINEERALSQIDKIKDAELLDIEADKHKKKKSRDSNAYAWALMQKLAEAIESDKWSVYLSMLIRYSGKFTTIFVREEAVEMMRSIYRATVDLGEIEVNGIRGRQLQVYYGASTFTQDEMNVFIRGIISECEEQGIQTITPAEAERMNALWYQHLQKI